MSIPFKNPFPQLEEATIVDLQAALAAASSQDELTVLLSEFKADLNAYLAQLASSPVRTLADIIAFNDAHADEELRYFGQELLLQAQEAPALDDERYLNALANNRRRAREEGIDAIMQEQRLDALVAPTTGPAWSIDLVNGDRIAGASTQPTALAGYPAISVPAGYAFELPIGLTFMGRAFSEPTLIKLAYAFEQATKVRRSPRYLPTVS